MLFKVLIGQVQTCRISNGNSRQKIDIFPRRNGFWSVNILNCFSISSALPTKNNSFRVYSSISSVVVISVNGIILATQAHKQYRLLYKKIFILFQKYSCETPCMSGNSVRHLLTKIWLHKSKPKHPMFWRLKTKKILYIFFNFLAFKVCAQLALIRDVFLEKKSLPLKNYLLLRNNIHFA